MGEPMTRDEYRRTRRAFRFARNDGRVDELARVLDAWFDATAARIAELEAAVDHLVVRYVPERERYLFTTPGAYASVMRGIEQAARGEAHYLGSFASWADTNPATPPVAGAPTPEEG